MLDFSAYITERTKDFTGREWLFTALDNWLKNKDAPRIFILTGEPGIGKSAIACRLMQFSAGQADPPPDCARLGRGFVSAAHICSARHGGWISPESFARSSSAQLAERYPAFAGGIQFDPHIQVDQQAGTVSGSMIGGKIENYYAENPEALFNSLVRQPLQTLCERKDVPEQIVLLVDGLDEALQSTSRPTIVQLLAKCHDLPKSVRLVLTTRWVDGVLDPFRSLKPFMLHADSQENQEDVQAYARARLSGMDARQVLYHVTPLSEVQQKILSLLGFPSDIYTRLVNGFTKPTGKMTEP